MSRRLAAAAALAAALAGAWAWRSLKSPPVSPAADPDACGPPAAEARKASPVLQPEPGCSASEEAPSLF